MQIHAPLFLFLVPKLFRFLPPHLRSPPPSRSHPSLVAMASILSAYRFRSESDLWKLRRLLRWQSPGFDGRVRCGAVPLRDLWFGEFIIIFFSSYTLSGLVFLFSSFFFFFTLLGTYNLQLHHLSPHSIMLVVIFIHLYEMYVGVRPSVRLFWPFHVLHSSRKGRPPSTATTSSIEPRV
jgi:hypothetical protein